MTCEEAGPFLPVLSDAALDPAERRAVESHLEGCARCRAARDRQRRLAGLVRSAGALPDPGERFWAEQRSRILGQAASGAAVRRRGGFGRAWLAAAAVLLVAAGLGVWFSGVFRRAGVGPAPGPGSTLAARPAGPAPVPEPPPSPPRVAPPREPAAPSARTLAAGARASTLGMTDEAVEIGLAETPADRVRALYRVAEARLGELRRALGQDPGLAAELASAYLLLLDEGVRSVLVDRDEAPAALADAKALAARQARSHEGMLAELDSTATGRLKETLDLALATSRELARP